MRALAHRPSCSSMSPFITMVTVRGVGGDVALVGPVASVGGSLGSSDGGSEWGGATPSAVSVVVPDGPADEDVGLQAASVTQPSVSTPATLTAAQRRDLTPTPPC